MTATKLTPGKYRLARPIQNPSVDLRVKRDWRRAWPLFNEGQEFFVRTHPAGRGLALAIMPVALLTSLPLPLGIVPTTAAPSGWFSDDMKLDRLIQALVPALERVSDETEAMTPIRQLAADHRAAMSLLAELAVPLRQQMNAGAETVKLYFDRHPDAWLARALRLVDGHNPTLVRHLTANAEGAGHAE